MRKAALALTAVLVTSACGAQIAPASTTPASGYPVTVRNCGADVRFDRAPSRVVANDIGITEIMFALGLADRMAGYTVDHGQDRGIASSPWRADFERVKRVAEDVALEPVQGVNADMVFAGWNYGFRETTGFTPDRLRSLGIASYLLTESCRNGTGNQRGIMPPLEALYTDLRNLGTIFGVRDRADRLVEQYQRQVAGFEATLPAGARPKVFLYDDGIDQPLTSGRTAGPQEIITRAGGVNVFADLNDSWTRVSWETVVRRSPDVILINDYGAGADESIEAKKRFLLSHPGLATVPAVRNQRFFVLPYAALVEGPRNPAAIVEFGRYLASVR
ncbi:iron complex transport system substrate-binding protein [Herbihabitans rhizosphaerae]|uniref:Iron complex transport system substrate-binding protein n=1 Tax=Herbihabitans rhizosphaerae TaxID=1872711 RepID=A0A4Q7KK07_9PSEU|nr:ABC transporter substrate-binding protein [Herbihabitans rhizosphaerae]RZS36785.1 iron complex transport system substrate-binding protein [Herbihabitans rhizosphaerae]